MKKLLIVNMFVLGLFLTACQSISDMSTSNTDKEQTSVSAEKIDWEKAGPDAKANRISFDMVKEDVESGAKFFDVRSAEEYKAGNFGITENFPITDLENGKLPELPKDTKIYVHCLKGIRSAQAVKLLRDAGYTQVFDMGGVEHIEAIGGILE
ncbi:MULTISPECIES: rhodanese-like domain-containing protein [Streptococcus]|uniref:Rhodanese-like domain-containing protein n=1 Tax=Streptococcus caledonicus TaxID=2614158 RepID=A0ABW0UAF6_9STRE|nr:rhodanese-like domain-containing protein [Streptococcus sp. S784/96/1]